MFLAAARYGTEKRVGELGYFAGLLSGRQNARRDRGGWGPRGGVNLNFCDVNVSRGGEKKPGREMDEKGGGGGRKRRRGDKTSRSGRSVLIKRSQRPRTLNAFEPVDVFQRGRIVNYGGRRRRRRSIGSRVYKSVSRARSRGARAMMDGERRERRRRARRAKRDEAALRAALASSRKEGTRTKDGGGTEGGRVEIGHH